MLTLQASETEIATLNYERFHYPCPIVQKRLHAVYLKLTQDHFSCTAIGTIVDLHRKTVSQCIHAYQEGGIKALCFNNYGTNQSKLEIYQQTIISDLTSHPVSCLSQAKERIKHLTGIERSLVSIRVFLKKHGFAYKKLGHIPAKASIEKQADYLENVLNPAIERAKNGEIHLLFMDAAHFVRGAFLCCVWCMARLFIKSPSGRERVNIIGAIDAVTKKLFFTSNTSFVNAEQLCLFLNYLRTQMTKKPIYLVLDNAPYQHCQLVKDFAQNLNITLLFLPAYAPNLNLIERLWKFVKKKALYAKFYENFTLFQNAILSTLNKVDEEYKYEIHALINLNFQTFENVTFYPL